MAIVRDQISWSTEVQWEMDTRGWCANQWEGNKSGWLKSRLYALMLESQKHNPITFVTDVSHPVGVPSDERVSLVRGLFGDD